MKIGTIKATVKGFKRTCTPFQKEKWFKVYGENLEKLSREHAVYKFENGNYPYGFSNGGNVCNAGNFKSIEGMFNHLKKYQYSLFSVDLVFVED